MTENSFSNLTEPYGFSLEGFDVDTPETNGVNNPVKTRLDSSTYRGNTDFNDSSATAQSSREKGWSSTPLPADADEEAVLQFNFDQERNFNRMSFELSNVPQYFAVYYFDTVKKEMVLLKDYRNNPIQGVVSGIREAVEGSGVAWVKFAYVLKPIKTNLVEFRIKRNLTDIVNLGLNPRTAYRIKLRHVYFRFHILPPPPPPDGGGGGGPKPPGDDDPDLPPEDDFPQYKILTFSASEALNKTNSFWQSPPLGPGSVYPFIVDLRDSDGNAQTFDTIKLVSLYTGSFLNVYYSNDDAYSNFRLSNNLKTLTLNTYSPDERVLPESEDFVLNSGIQLLSNKYWDIDNLDLRLHTALPFTAAMQLQMTNFDAENPKTKQHISTLKGTNSDLILTFEDVTIVNEPTAINITQAQSVDYLTTVNVASHSFVEGDYVQINDLPIEFYNGVWKIQSTTSNSVTVKINKKNLPLIEGPASGTIKKARSAEGTLKFSQKVGSTITEIASLETIFVENYRYCVGFSYNKSSSTWNLFKCRVGSSTIEIDTASALSFQGEFVQKLILGGKQPNTLSSFESFDGLLSNLWIRQEEYAKKVLEAFSRNTKRFATGVGERSSKLNGYYNALVMAPLTSSLTYHYGPNRAFYDAKEWKPVNQDFVLNTDIFRLGLSVTAKFVKLEFSKPVGRYYNPATLENIVLPIYSYPAWVRKWFLDNHGVAPQSGGYAFGNAIFEPTNTLNSRSITYGLINIKSALDGSTTSTIFNPDNAGIDYLLDSNRYDEFVLAQQIKRSSIHMRFPLVGTHNYQLSYFPMRHKRAYFYGIQSLEFLKLDQTRSFNNKTYLATALDTSWIDQSNSHGFRAASDEEEFLFAEEIGATLQSKVFKSFSSFKNFQFGALSSQLTDLFTPDQIHLVDVSHLNRFNLSSSSEASLPINTQAGVEGPTDGKVILLNRINAGQYGINTDSITLSSAITNVVHSGITLVAACRLRSFDGTPNSTYELRLQVKGSNGSWYTAASKPIVPTVQYQEYEIAYLTQLNEVEFRLQLIQTNYTSSDKIYVDMLGLWMSPFKVEIASDFNGSNVATSFFPLLFNISNPFGISTIPSSTNEFGIKSLDKFCVKFTALKVSAWLSGWAAIPHYINVPTNLSTYIWKQNDWAVSDNILDRLASRQMFFSNSTNKMLPRSYSTYNDIVAARKVF